MYSEVDDCNLKFIDCVALKRFMAKCGLVLNSTKVMTIIRRWDLDADAKLSKHEFLEAITP